MSVTCGVPTKGRYGTLALTLEAIAFQTIKDFDLIVVDDSDEPRDLRELPEFQSVFQLLNAYNINWKVLFGRKLGQHHSHQMIQEDSGSEWIWRVDDDEIPEPDVLRRLLSHAGKSVGAVGGLVLSANVAEIPKGAKNLIRDVHNSTIPNVQWVKHPKNHVIEVEHLHSTFLYRRNIVSYELSLSRVAHREETIFTYELFKKGYKLLLDPTAVTWHFRAEAGGIRSHNDPILWENDEKIFNQKLAEWGVDMPEPIKYIVLDCGKGDHVMVKSLLPRIRKKYVHPIICSCFDDVFEGDNVQLMSIAEAKQRLGPLDRFNIYKWAIDHNWKTELTEAFAKMYEL